LQALGGRLLVPLEQDPAFQRLAIYKIPVDVKPVTAPLDDRVVAERFDRCQHLAVGIRRDLYPLTGFYPHLRPGARPIWVHRLDQERALPELSSNLDSPSERLGGSLRRRIGGPEGGGQRADQRPLLGSTRQL
jgi:hypothetical protein